MKTIHKFFVGPGSFAIEMPIGAHVISAQTQHGEPQMWAIVDTDAPMETRRFVTFGTGHELPTRLGRFVGTFQLERGDLVFHLFEE